MTRIIKQLNYKDYFADISIPENWETLEEFVDWYINSRMPFMAPVTNAKIIVTDNATTATIFRHKQYQVELYLVHQDTTIVEHSHPGMELTMMQLGNLNNITENWGYFTPILESGEQHGGRPEGHPPFNSGNGVIFLTFEKWDSDIPITSAALQWEGNTHGPIQDRLIEEHKSRLENSTK